MSALNDLSPVAKHALWVSCMASNVPVQLADPTTVARVTALLRSGSPTDDKARGAVAARVPSSSTDITKGSERFAIAPNGPRHSEEPM